MKYLIITIILLLISSFVYAQEYSSYTDPDLQECNGSTEVSIEISGKFGLCWNKNDSSLVVKYGINQSLVSGEDGEEIIEYLYSDCNDWICEANYIDVPDEKGTYYLKVLTYFASDVLVGTSNESILHALPDHPMGFFLE